MILFFEVLNGEASGKTIEITQGLRIGRTTADLQLSDPKVSGLHAMVHQGPGGEYFLIDMDSSNGILLHGTKTKKIRLLAGLVLTIGNTQLKVIEPEQVNVVQLQNQKDWKDRLAEGVRDIGFRKHQSNPMLHPFPAMVELSFVRGPQLDELYSIGYGPREAGLFSMDIPLKEAGAPDRAFVIHWPMGGGPRVQNLAGSALKINDRDFENQEIKSGDYLSLLTTRIEVRLKEGGV